MPIFFLLLSARLFSKRGFGWQLLTIRRSVDSEFPIIFLEIIGVESVFTLEEVKRL